MGVVIQSEVSAGPGDKAKAENVEIATVEDIGAEAYLRYLRKGHKWERERARRQALIAERMKGMEQLKQQCRAERRALRLGKVIGGKKPKYDEIVGLLIRDIKDRELAIPAGMKRRAELVRSLPSRTMRFTEWPLDSLVDHQSTKAAAKIKPED
ncbi:hypothetical protein F1559_001843 [Cyanidiococcus yangmingshanensis]|uniref:Uncharacterized protein n=1 Tax=Cyanidiococcus yangmingshanensis TaxID=2690220 RepID=A0A7J7IS36_9RHOD|nr:hypothetical protein F1559_001843 [Cyanidiococcus yangmingshanensis]